MASRSARTDGQRLDAAIASVGLYDLQVHSLTASDLTKTFFGIVQEFDGRDGFGIEAGFAGFHARQREQIFGQA